MGLSACNKDKVPEPPPAEKSAETPAPEKQSEPAPPAKSAAAQPASAQQGNEVAIEWKVPEGWSESPNKSPMRKATYKTPDGAELAVFYFGASQGGDVKANIDRWVGQFKDVPDDAVKRDQKEANGLVQHVVEVKSGTYSGSMMMGGGKEVPDQGLLGAVVESPSGKYFFKLTGPAKAVAAQRDGFFALLASMKPKS